MSILSRHLWLSEEVLEIWTSPDPHPACGHPESGAFAFLVYAAGSDKPVLNSSIMLVGHSAAYLGAGIVLASGLESVSGRLANPIQIDFVIELVIGLVLLRVACQSRGAEKKIRNKAHRE